ncbi:MAG TPA: hypothetical protein VFE47_19610 [Tepidisphaeraceae bacterium]|jgi:hypothetical protein|nr:hypothetical protein [Tepidisphaeraceae bacterium]
MDASVPQFRLPRSRIIANTIWTGLLALIIAAVLYGVGNALPKWKHTSRSSTGSRVFRVGFDGVELEFGPPKPTMTLKPNSDDDPNEGLNFLGLEWQHYTLEWRNAAVRWRTTTLGFPWWPFAMVFLIRPIYRMTCAVDEHRILTARRKRAMLIDLTHCAVCGYDLRATPNRCPECGTVPAAVG